MSVTGLESRQEVQTAATAATKVAKADGKNDKGEDAAAAAAATLAVGIGIFRLVAFGSITVRLAAAWHLHRHHSQYHGQCSSHDVGGIALIFNWAEERG